MLTEPFLNARFWSTRKRLLHESSNVFVEEVWNVICLLQGERGYLLPPFGVGGGGGGEGTKRRITFQTMVKHVPLVAGIQFPTQSCLSHDHWFINGCSHYCRSSSSADFTQSLLFSFSLRKTPRGYLKKNYSGEAHITKAWKRYPFRAKPTCTRIYTPLLGVTPPPSPLPWRKANGLLKGWGIPTIAEKRKIIITTT